MTPCSHRMQIHRQWRAYGLAYAVLLTLGLSIAPLISAGTPEEKGTIFIQILYHGNIPAPTAITVTRDADTCGTTMAMSAITVNPASKGLKDAVVDITVNDKAGSNDPIRTTATLINAKCVFSPHVIALRTGEALHIQNHDPILHNTHIKTKTRTFINVAQPANGRSIAKIVKYPGLYQLQCDAHKFMRGHIIAYEHPYFAVSDEDGRATIRQVPPGSHLISVWHETLGRIHGKVIVPAHGDTALTLEFTGRETLSSSESE